MKVNENVEQWMDFQEPECVGYGNFTKVDLPRYRRVCQGIECLGLKAKLKKKKKLKDRIRSVFH